ncbi:MAG: OB-fold protein [Chitinophagaceae bacterium]
MSNKKSSWLKRLLISVLLLAGIGAGIYWYIATEKFADTKEREAAFTVNAIDFIREFRKDDSVSNKKYRDKIISVNGTVSELESPDSATVNIKFIDTTTGDYTIFAFQEQYLSEAKSVKVGDSVSVKGSCSGSIYSNLLDAYNIGFIRCTLNK